MNSITLCDGRELAYDEYGDPNGVPVIFNHGASDSRLIRNPDEILTTSLGIRVIAPDQPGVGGSTPQPNRRMVDWGGDVEELANSLGLDRFAVAGHSGGSPHALAIAYRLPERVTKLVLASPASPLAEPGISKLLTNKDLQLIVKLHNLHLQFLIKWGIKLEVKKALKNMPGFVEETARKDPSDAGTFLRDPAQRNMFEASFTAGMAHGGEGLHEMVMALWNWGFEPEDINLHVEMFYGDADDILDIKMPLHLAERLPDCATHVWKGAGHYGFVNRDRWLDFFGAAV